MRIITAICSQAQNVVIARILRKRSPGALTKLKTDRLAAMVIAREARYGAIMTHSEGPQHITQPQLAQLADAAAASARRRSHILLHADHQDQVQRLLIALEPDSYVRPHLHSEQWEMIVLLRGRLDLLIFSPRAELTQRLVMSATSPVVQIPQGTWHGGVALQSQTMVLEVKPGPYRPNEFATWGPGEGAAASGAFVHWAKGADLGAKWQTPASAA
jgi:cupin fold WbuC family metalloprotein